MAAGEGVGEYVSGVGWCAGCGGKNYCEVKGRVHSADPEFLVGEFTDAFAYRADFYGNISGGVGGGGTGVEITCTEGFDAANLTTPRFCEARGAGEHVEICGQRCDG